MFAGEDFERKVGSSAQRTFRNVVVKELTVSEVKTVEERENTVFSSSIHKSLSKEIRSGISITS